MKITVIDEQFPQEYIDLNKDGDELIPEVVEAADRWGVDNPHRLLFIHRPRTLALAHNILVDEVISGNITNIKNTAGYFVMCARKLERNIDSSSTNSKSELGRNSDTSEQE